MEKCPICNVNVLREEGLNGLSRKDNKTEICGECSQEEAMQEFHHHMKLKNDQT